MMKKRIIIATLILLLVILGRFIYVYEYQIQKGLALNKFERYIKKQGVDVNKIIEKKVVKDWKNGGYLIRVSFEDDINNTYYYRYYLWTHKRDEELRLDRMFLTISNGHHQLDAPLEGKCKYPPIEED